MTDPKMYTGHIILLLGREPETPEETYGGIGGSCSFYQRSIRFEKPGTTEVTGPDVVSQSESHKQAEKASVKEIMGLGYQCSHNGFCMSKYPWPGVSEAHQTDIQPSFTQVGLKIQSY